MNFEINFLKCIYSCNFIIICDSDNVGNFRIGLNKYVKSCVDQLYF